MEVALDLQPCCGNRSGVGNYAYELARRLRDGDGLTFCGNVFNFLGRNDNGETLRSLPMPVRTFKAFPYTAYQRIWNVLPIPYQRLFGRHADLSVFFNFVVPPRVSGRIVTTVHDMTYLRFPETVERKVLSRLTAELEDSVGRCDRVLTVSEFTRREMIDLLGVDGGKISVVPSAPSLTRETADFDACAAKYGIQKPYLLYVGTIEPRKNLARLIRAFSLLKREQGIAHRLVLAGGRGWLSEEIDREAARAQDVIFTGYIPAAEKNALYKNAEAFVFPSLYEGFGEPPLEAMTFGCPVVCADAASLPEVAGDAAELVSPFDEAGIAQGIFNVISSEARARELSRRGYEQVKRYDWDASAQKLRRICLDVLGAA